MSQIANSVPVTALIAPTDSADTYPTHAAIYGKGGLRTVSSIAERDAIPVSRREAGMLVFVAGNYYRLLDNLVDWEDLGDLGTGSSGGGSGKYAGLVVLDYAEELYQLHTRTDVEIQVGMLCFLSVDKVYYRLTAYNEGAEIDWQRYTYQYLGKFGDYVSVPTLQLKLERTNSPDETQIYDRVFARWNAEDIRFLDWNPEVWLFRYSNKRKIRTGTNIKVRKKGFFHPSHQNGLKFENSNFFGGGQHFLARADRLPVSRVQPFGSDEDSSLVIPSLNSSPIPDRNTEFGCPYDRNYWEQLYDFNPAQWFSFKNMETVTDTNATMQRTLGSFDTVKVTSNWKYHSELCLATEANIHFVPASWVIVNSSDKLLKLGQITRSGGTKSNKKSRWSKNRVQFKFAIVIDNPAFNPTQPQTDYNCRKLIGPMSQTVCFHYASRLNADSVNPNWRVFNSATQSFPNLPFPDTSLINGFFGILSAPN
jgi:hypothetical protein